MTEDESPLLFARHRGMVMGLLPVLLAAAALYLCASHVERAIDVPSWALKLAAVLLGVGAFLITARSFRCPGCRTNLLLHAQFREPIGNFVETALAYRVCPKCGFREQNF